jgi:hypothetical protein
VSFDKRASKWQAYYQLNGPQHIGYFDDEVEAARAVDVKVASTPGVKKIFNFPQEHFDESNAAVYSDDGDNDGIQSMEPTISDESGALSKRPKKFKRRGG